MLNFTPSDIHRLQKEESASHPTSLLLVKSECCKFRGDESWTRAKPRVRSCCNGPVTRSRAVKLVTDIELKCV